MKETVLTFAPGQKKEEIYEQLARYQKENAELKAREKKLVRLLQRLLCFFDKDNRAFREELMELEPDFGDQAARSAH